MTVPLATWNIDTNYAASQADSNVTAGDIAQSGSLSSFVRSLISGADYAIEIGTTAADATEAVSESQYFAFTVTAAAAYNLYLHSLVFDGARGGATGTRGYVVRSSVDGYAANLAAADFVAQVSTPPMDTVRVDLTGSSYQGLSAVTFRIYAYSSGGTTLTVAFDDVTVNGAAIQVGAGQLVQFGIG